jgi:lysozyme
VGRNLEDKGIRKTEAMYLLREDVNECIDDLEDVLEDSWAVIEREREKALVDMRFQLGFYGFRSFRKMIQAIRNDDWQRAADEALDSRWAQQTPERAQEIATMLRDG